MDPSADRQQITVCFADSEIRALRKAAALKGSSLEEYVARVAIEKAHREIIDSETTAASPEDLIRAIDLIGDR